MINHQSQISSIQNDIYAVLFSKTYPSSPIVSQFALSNVQDFAVITTNT